MNSASSPPTPAENDEAMAQAARRIRDAVRRCSSGRVWTPDIHKNGRAWINITTPDDQVIRHAWGMTGFPGEAAYAGLLDPSAGLLVADLLDDMAGSSLVFGSRSKPVRLARHLLTGSPDPAGFTQF